MYLPRLTHNWARLSIEVEVFLPFFWLGFHWLRSRREADDLPRKGCWPNDWSCSGHRVGMGPKNGPDKKNGIESKHFCIILLAKKDRRLPEWVRGWKNLKSVFDIIQTCRVCGGGDWENRNTDIELIDNEWRGRERERERERETGIWEMTKSVSTRRSTSHRRTGKETRD